MKKMKIILYTLIISLIFIGSVQAATFTCTLDGYKIEYDSSGKIVSSTNADGTKINKYLSSYFKPKNTSECPTENQAKVSIIDGGRTFYVAQKDETFGGETLSPEDKQKKQDKGGCSGYTYEKSCLYNDYYSCVWNDNEYGTYCNTDKLVYISCGDVFDIPVQVPSTISLLVNLLKIAAPIVLIIVSIISLLKALSASSEDEIKKAQKGLIRKLIAGVMVFFVISIVQFVIMKVADISEKTNLSDCLSCFLNNSCQESVYYKTGVGSEYLCTSLKTGTTTKCDKFYIDVTNFVINSYYSGTVTESCNDEYFSNGYQPKSIEDGGTCYSLESTGKKIINYTTKLNGVKESVTQTLWNANNKCYYWEGRKNKYINISCDTEVVTPHYIGPKASSCNGKYFSNGYQPKSISISGNCYNLEDSGKKYDTQTLWKANNKCYYWKGSQNQYIETSCN